MSSSLFRSVGSAIATGTQLTPSGVVMMVASGIAEFRDWMEHLGQPARQVFGAGGDGFNKAGMYPTLRASGFTDTQLATAANSNTPTRVITLTLADGTIVFAGTVK